VVTPEGAQPLPEWSAQERAAGPAARHGQRSEAISTHFLYLAGREKPHYHDRHDLNVHLLRGAGTVHFRERAVTLEAGDTLFIPRGTFHWVESTGDEPLQAFATYSPAFDGQDRRLAESVPPDL